MVLLGGRGIFGNDILEETDCLHRGVFVAGLNHGNGDLLHRHPLPQVDGDNAASRRAAHSVDACRQGVVKGYLNSLAALSLHGDTALLHPAAYGGDNLQLADLHGVGQHQRDHNTAVIHGGKGDSGALLGEKVVQLTSRGGLGRR